MIVVQVELPGPSGPVEMSCGPEGATLTYTQHAGQSILVRTWMLDGETAKRILDVGALTNEDIDELGQIGDREELYSW